MTLPLVGSAPAQIRAGRERMVLPEHVPLRGEEGRLLRLVSAEEALELIRRRMAQPVGCGTVRFVQLLPVPQRVVAEDSVTFYRERATYGLHMRRSKAYRLEKR